LLNNTYKCGHDWHRVTGHNKLIHSLNCYFIAGAW